MKRIVSVLVCLAVLWTPASAYWLADDDAVYVTPYGECYHQLACGYVTEDTVSEMTYLEAVAVGYRECSWCINNEGDGDWEKYGSFLWYNPYIDQWQDEEGYLYSYPEEAYEAMGYSSAGDGETWVGDYGYIRDGEYHQFPEEMPDYCYECETIDGHSETCPVNLEEEFRNHFEPNQSYHEHFVSQDYTEEEETGEEAEDVPPSSKEEGKAWTGWLAALAGALFLFLAWLLSGGTKRFSFGHRDEKKREGTSAMKVGKISVGKIVLSTLLFWAILLFGPFLLVLWNELSPVRYEQGSLGFLFFSTIVQGLAGLIAWYAASHVFEGKCCQTTGINCVVGATLFVPLTFISAVSWQEVISNGVAVVALIAGAIYCFAERNKEREKAEKQRKEQGERFKELNDLAQKIGKDDA